MLDGAFSTPVCVTVVAPPITCIATRTLFGTAATGYEARIDWFGTIRGRAGYLITDQVLLFATGGMAYGQVEMSGTSTSTAQVPGTILSFSSSTESFSATRTNVGYMVGGGLEGKFAPWLPPNWTWKMEYLYVDLGSLNSGASFGGTFSPAGSTIPLAGTVAMHTHFTDNIARVGINYQFGGL